MFNFKAFKNELAAKFGYRNVSARKVVCGSGGFFVDVLITIDEFDIEERVKIRDEIERTFEWFLDESGDPIWKLSLKFKRRKGL